MNEVPMLIFQESTSQVQPLWFGVRTLTASALEIKLSMTDTTHAPQASLAYNFSTY